MGNTQPTLVLVPTQLQPKLNHEFINNPTLLLHQNQQYLQVSHAVEQSQYRQWQSSLNLYKQQDTDYVLLPVKSKFTLTGVCTSIGNAEILYDHLTQLMSQEILQRRNRYHSFEESQIWLLLLSLIKADGQARPAGDSLGDIRPNNVFKTDEGKIKIACLSSWPQATNSFQRALQKLPAFASPQDMDNLAKGSLQSPNTQASLIFSIGLTLLSLANTVDYQILYKMQEWAFCFQQFNQAVLKLKCNRQYSEVLRCTIANLCSIHPQRRMGISQLQSMLLKHQVRISTSQQLVIECPPDKLREEMGMLHTLMMERPSLFASPLLLSEAGGSGITFPEHLKVQRIQPQYFLDLNPTIIKGLEQAM